MIHGAWRGPQSQRGNPNDDRLERGDRRGARGCVAGDRGLALAPPREIIELVVPIRLSFSAGLCLRRSYYAKNPTISTANAAEEILGK
jgi:hypothetical protein